MNHLTTADPTTSIQTATRTNWDYQRGLWLANFRSDKTRQAYADGWNVFGAFMGGMVTPDQITQDHVIAYKLHLENATSARTGKPISRATINQRISALSSFYAWLVGRGLLPVNPCDGVTRQAISPYGRATFLDTDTRQDCTLLDVIDPTTLQGKRDRAIVLLFLTSGIRVGVIPQLTVGSIRGCGSKICLYYVNKGGEEVQAELAPETAAAIADYLAARGDTDQTSALFIATRGRKGRAAALTGRGVHALVVSYCDKAFGVGHGIHPHSLRHTAAQAAISEGFSITEVSRLLKHKSLAVTTLYLHATDRADGKIARKLGRRYSRD